MEQSTTHFSALPSNVFIHPGDAGSAARSSSGDDHRLQRWTFSAAGAFSVTATWRTVSRDASHAGKCHRAPVDRCPPR
ncbi:hypothetical protein WN51_08320 [Melipona quadrifasciata]|uniref:Uncharacterized protein n=1 Tax=Melipona quadrifasciata TaxID=166423 RepID=A0A0N0U7A3_9HYME|nr:hypothetical protein WN51_08320 [Melipona quadrifasciata]